MKQQTALLRSKQLDQVLAKYYFCPSCTQWRKSSVSSISNDTSRTKRHASTFSRTAINATKHIPTRYKSLYESLSNIRKKAPAHVNLSRLQLALQGLESEEPTIRVAVLGLNVQDTARRIVRLLLADALDAEERWEKQLLDKDDVYSDGLLIRYGQAINPNLHQRTAVPVLQIPSSVLEKLNIEILISSISSASRTSQYKNTIPADTFLSPIIRTPTDAGGRQTTISQPVHKTLLVADQLSGLLAASDLLSSTLFETDEDRNSITIAVNLDKSNLKGDHNVLIVDDTKAEEGLDAVRSSLAKATTYEQFWLESGMPQMSKWLTLTSASRNAEVQDLAPSIKDLISSLLTTTTSNIQAASIASTQASESQGLSMATRINLGSAIDDFSRSAHQELQAGLASAWSSRNWRKLAWYKLFWRVDDIGLIVTDLVNNAWLPNTERATYELSGRLAQVGISPMVGRVSIPFSASPALDTITAPILQIEPQAQMTTPAGIATAPLQAVIANETGAASVKMAPLPQLVPIASTVSSARNSYMSTSIINLTSTAQQLVLRTLSISSMSAGLSALTYLSTLSGTVYEAGTIFAVGTIFALWRMQTGWLRATKDMEDGLFEEGRRVISGVVDRIKSLVEAKSVNAIDPIEQEANDQARKAVDTAKAELDKVLDTTSQVGGEGIQASKRSETSSELKL